MEDIETIATYALSRIMMYEPRIGRALIEGMGCAADVFKLTPEEILKVLGPYSRYSDRILNADMEEYHKELEALLQRGCRYITSRAEVFPSLLNECEDGPLGLFVQSDDEDAAIFGREKISIVGTRDMTQYGSQWCKNTISSLAKSETRPTIVSGLAYGIDITAHLQALEEGLPTIAVLGTGIFNTYPASHQKYADKIVHTPQSAVISEFPPTVDVTAVNFLSRNRIIAGLSRCTMLMESHIKGGGMSTARLAYSYGREVFALPGRNDDIRSQGCNYLIHSHIAEPLIGTDELFKSLDYRLGKSPHENISDSLRDYYKGSMDAVDIKRCDILMKAIRSDKGIRVDELVATTGINAREVNILVGRLENDGFLEIDLLQQCYPTLAKRKP